MFSLVNCVYLDGVCSFTADTVYHSNYALFVHRLLGINKEVQKRGYKIKLYLKRRDF